MAKQPKLLLDSNILTDGLFSRFGLSKAVLALCAAKTCRLVLAEWVKIEVERNILKKAGSLSDEDLDTLIDDYHGFLKLARPLTVPLADEPRIIEHRSIIRHFADVPVVLAAIDSGADWIITKNRDHFTDEVANKIGIRIASPSEFFTGMIESFQK